MKLENLFMLKTAYADVYAELVTNKKYFTRQVQLFVAGLAIGVVKNRKSTKTPNRDIVRMVILENNLGLFKDVIDLVAEIVCINMDEKECGAAILSYADGGIEYIWDEYKTQGTLDLPRIYDEIKNEWPNAIEAISQTLETEINNF